jgi:uncharacterized protein YndB with AHSA1/START domain
MYHVVHKEGGSMMQMHVEAEGTTRATPEVAWSLIADANTYAKWGPWDASGYESGRNDAEQGVGTVQWFRVGRTTSVEQTLEIEEGRRFVYTVIRGVPVHNYRAEVTLTPSARGTHIRWAATWDKTLVGRIVHRKLRSFYPEMMAGLVAAADRGDTSTSTATPS